MSSRPVPAGVKTYRDNFRAESLGPRYSGWAHLAATSLGSLGAVAFALSRLDSPSLSAWLWFPATFLIANLVEFLMHRGPMHRPAPLLGEIYARHALQHHSFYTHQAMPAESARDFKMVLFPPIAIFLFLGVIGGPIGALVYFLAGPNAGWLFVAAAVGYFLTYEWLHLAYHLPPAGFVGRLPGIGILRRHHTVHHDPRLMGRWNFNITFPIFDRVFGTHYDRDFAAREATARRTRRTEVAA